MKQPREYIIPVRGLSTGSHEFTFKVNNAFFAHFENPELSEGNLEVVVEADKQQSMLVLHVAINGTVKTICDRCLDPFLVPVHYEGELLVKFSSILDEDDSDDEVIYMPPQEGELDLAQYIYESIYLSLPLQRVHGNENDCNREMLQKLKELSVKADK